ncbi:enterochelin esterase domain-containing protein [Cupriavidus alkaliphilus]|uniref:enterochelin esterase domain-containing protein n=1 Tax=Cupriavidus alkaliphilus TaxID=942866 RepID=UPI000DC3C5FE|nr:alpha/beta hydrolase-fold protein [Cupriavidus alkaliphilus]RAS00383.1 enterochelin esterase family protein [Cupriavidus alkaliphilus]
MRFPVLIRRRAAWLSASLMLSLAAIATPAVASAPALAVGQPAHGVWQPGAPLHYTLSLQAGDVVRGLLDGPAATLDLADAAGKPVRRLLGPTTLSRSFLFVAPGSGAYRLTVSGDHADVPGAVGGRPLPGAPYVLRIDEIVPRAAQHAPADLPDSLALRELAQTLADGGNTEAFWQDMARRGTPLVEPLPATGGGQEAMVRVTFLWRGARDNVRLLGSPAGDHDALLRLGDSDVWYRSYRVPATTRMSYQLAPDVPVLDQPAPQRRRAILATVQRDPLNPRTLPDQGADPFQLKSVLELPAAPPQPWLAPRAGVPAGTVTPYRIDSRILGEARDIYVYRPARARPTATLVLFDAHAYLSLVPTPNLLDNLIDAGLLPPVAALIVANPSAAARAAQLPPNPAFADFLANELMPWAATVGLSAPAERTVVAGSSYGGLAAAYAGLRHPERFGLVLSQSGSFWWGPGGAPDQPPRQPQWLIREYAASPRLPLRFYLEAGRFEDGRGAVNILTTTRHMRDVLVAKGYPVVHAEHASGHDYLQWRGTLACGLIALLGRPERVDAEVASACPALRAGTSAAMPDADKRPAPGVTPRG